MCADNVHFCFISPHTMILLSLRYALFFIASFNNVNGYSKVNFNLTNEIRSLALYLKEHDLTIVDLDYKRILYFIVNKNQYSIRDFRRSDDDGIERQVVKKLDHIMSALTTNGMYASFPVGPSKQEQIAYIDDFMSTRIQSTQYLYEEYQRIKHKGVVKDSLRKMISFLEMPEYHWVEKKVFRCFVDARKKVYNPPLIYWTHNTNDMTYSIV